MLFKEKSCLLAATIELIGPMEYFKLTVGKTVYCIPQCSAFFFSQPPSPVLRTSQLSRPETEGEPTWS